MQGCVEDDGTWETVNSNESQLVVRIFAIMFVSFLYAGVNKLYIDQKLLLNDCMKPILILNVNRQNKKRPCRATIDSGKHTEQET